MNRFQFRVWNKETNSFLDSEYFKITGNGAVENYTNENENDTNCVIQQFTGILDKNGKKIFEGDIIKNYSDNNRLCEIGYYDDVCAAFGYRGLEVKGDFYLLHTYKSGKDFEIIGNIFENPELLK